ncbi:D-amino acid aminotransferase [Blautia schinkii]|nr:D-amino acid aminotransferase [Blautia schinkii]
MKRVGYYNGEIAPVEELKIPVLDRAYYFGDGVYDATSVANGQAFALEEHIDRFYNSCRLLEIDFPMTKAELAEELMKVVKEFDGENGLLYWQASRGTAYRGHKYPDADVKPNLMIMLNPINPAPMEKKVNLITMEDTRYFHCNIKTLNLIPNVMAAQKAESMGCDETIFHRGERVTECAHSNVSIIKDGVLRTAPCDNLILPGITRKHMIELAHELDIPVVEEAFTVSDLFEADEVIVSRSGALCHAAETIDGKPVGGKAPEILDKLYQAYYKKFRIGTGQYS